MITLVQKIRSRPLKGDYPFLCIDPIYEKVRLEGRVQSVVVMIAYGVDNEGQRGGLAVEPMYKESEDIWKDFIKGLKRSCATRVGMVISDAHQGIQAAYLFDQLDG